MTALRRGAVVVVCGLALAAGCSSGEDDSPAVADIESIIEGDIVVNVDPAATSATLEVTTTIPVACAAIYGVDDSFGSIAVDNDMGGGAHRDHAPLLTGLIPDTEYRYVLQGSDAAGTLYRSDVMTFRTPPAPVPAFGANVAPGGQVTAASSEFSDQFAAEHAIDGDLATEWATSGDGDGAWIEIDLTRRREITAVAFRTRQMTDGTAITETFTVTVDDQVLGPFPTGTDPAVLDEPVAARILRIDADRTTGGNTGASEIEIYSRR